MLLLLIIENGETILDDACPTDWNLELVCEWAEQRKTPTNSIDVVCDQTGSIVVTM